MATNQLRIIMTPVGSSGDVHPFVGIGRALQSRGHEVIVVTAANFRAVVEEAGLQFVAFPASEEHFDRTTRDPDLWHPRRGVAVVLRLVVDRMRDLYAHLADLYEPGRSVLVGHTMSFATRVFEDKHQAPAVTLHLAPSVFRSLYQTPAPAVGKDLSPLPRWVKRSLWWVVDRMMFDPHVERGLNCWREQLGLDPVCRIFKQWIHSPQRVIGLFPEWFAPPQPDWPSALRLTGFPLFDETGQHELDPQVQAFLRDSSPPIVFTPGSANQHAARFFRVAVDVGVQLKRPVLLLTRYPHQVPDSLPDIAMHRPYLPLSRVLPHCAAIVHHGGIGTCAQGLAAGVAQLVMPLGFDQPDNVTRLHRLGVGAWVEPKRFTADRVARSLQALSDDTAVAAACRRYAGMIQATAAIEQTCQLIEQAAQR